MLSPHICEQARLSRDPRFDGLFFILVRTTKIFCRNTCRVRAPLEKNVSYTPSAQLALELGYRPCLRCRPDSAPNSCAWQGTHTTVNRAMQLLSQQQQTSVELVATRLGITARYLNKLFNTHLQISPKRFRVYQQVLMAKSLLQQTVLPIEQVAQSVGFANARQLQQHVQTHLHLSPSQIRKTPMLKTSPSNNNMSTKVELLLNYRPPYNWPQVRDFFARRAIHNNEQVTDNGFAKILDIEGLAVPVEILHCPDKHGFYLSFSASFAAQTLGILAIVKRMLDLDADPHTIKTALVKAGLSEHELVEGIRVPGVASEFEAGCRAILGQQVSVAAAVNKVNDFHNYFVGDENSAFVSPDEVIKNDLMWLKIPSRRRQTLLDLAAFFTQNHSEKPNQNRDKTHAQINTENHASALLDIKGIGPWTVNYIEMRAKGNADVWLDTDLIIKQQGQKFTDQSRPLNSDLAAPWRSYLTLTLWSLS